MLLDATTKKLQVVLSGAVTTNQLDVVTSWFDSGATPTGGEADTTTNNTTAVDIVAAPASGYIRQVKYIGVYNADTANATVKIRYNNNGTIRVLVAAVLAPNYTLQWNPKDGWQILATSSASGGFLDGSASAPGIFFVNDTDTGLFRPSNDVIGFATGGTERMRLSSSGLSFDGGTTFYTAGAVQTFTPTLAFGGGATGLTYSVQVGRYLRWGPIVNFFVRINLSNKGSSTGNAVISGLPITAANVSNGYHFNTVSFTNMNSSGDASGANQQGAYITPNTTTITLVVTKTGSDTSLTDAAFTNTSWINVHGWYEV